MGRRDNRKYGNQGRDQINIERVGGNVLLNSQDAIRPDAEKDLLEAVRRWVESRLEGQLHHAVKLNLQKETQPQQVRPWGMEMKVAVAQSSQLLPPETSIGQVFDQCLGRLLILGEPGAGKTTSLLDLALELVERAEDDPQQRIPVIVDLSDWQPIVSQLTSRRNSIVRQNSFSFAAEQAPGCSISNWLIGKVRERYGVLPKQVKQWLEEKRLVPLLDGLDEVSPENQKDCVRAINLWLDSDWRPRQVAVCCRREPYETYPEKLKLDGAVYLQDLTDEQLQTFLTEANRGELKESLLADQNLLALIRRPLLLSIAIIAHKELEPIQWQQATSAGDRLNLLLNAYVRQMLTQDTLSRAYRNRKPPDQEQSRKWLEILALQLLQDSENDFLLERIHTTWLLTLLEKCLFIALSIVVWGVVFGMAFWVLPPTILFWLQFFGSIDPLQFKMVSSRLLKFGFFAGSVYGLSRGVQVFKDLLFIESVTKAIRNSLSYLKKLLFIESIARATRNSLSDLNPGKRLRKLSSWKTKLIPSQVSTLTYKLVKLTEPRWRFNLEDWLSSVKTLSVPNQGIKDLLRNAILIILILVPLHTLTVCILLRSVSSLGYIILISLCIASLLWIWLGGGNICINHFLVHFCLYVTKSTPWDYTRFLNYATERLLFQRTGGSYRFIHDLLRQLFAQSRVNSYPHLISPQVFLRCGKSYASMEQHDKALQNLNCAIELRPSYVPAITQRSITYREMERYEEALQDFNRAIELDSKDTWLIAQRGITYREMERYEEALQDFNRAIELDSKDTWLIAQRGITYREMERYEEALQDFNRAIELDSKDTWLIAQRGITYREMERYEEALQDFNRAIELNSKDVFAIAARGITYSDMERYEEALQDFNRAIGIDPKYTFLLTQRSRLYLDIGWHEEALQDLNRAIEIDPNYSYAFVERSRIYRFLRQDKEALQDISRAIDLESRDYLLYLRGRIYCLVGSHKEALQDINRAIDLDPKSAQAIAWRGFIHTCVKHYEEALQNFNHAIELKPKDDWYLYLRALNHFVRGQAVSAKADLNKAIQIAQQEQTQKPSNHQNTFNLAIYNLIAGNLSTAQEFYQSALRQCTSQTKIWIAIEDLKDLLQIFPENITAQEIIVMLEEKIGANRFR
jgi:tetratricopeptide (TPR) repeat protein